MKALKTALTAGSTLLLLAMGAAAQSTPSPYKPNASVPIDAFDLPMSAYVSDDFKRVFMERQAVWASLPVAPALDAPKADWDRYDAENDRVWYAPMIDAAEKQYPVTTTAQQMGGVNVGVIVPVAGVAPKNKNRVLINLHGGGFTVGRGLKSGLSESIQLASMGGYKIVAIDYRQAPEAQFPAASEDVAKVYRELLKSYKPESIGIFGCSAGGSLTGQAVAWFQANRLPRPGAIGIFSASNLPSPWTGDSAALWDLHGWPVSDAPPQSRPASSSPGAKRAYMATAGLHDPLAYPAASDAVFSQFPATLYLTGSRATEESSAIVAHAKLLKLGVDSQLYIVEGAQHCAITTGAGLTPEGRDAISYIAHWFDQHLAP